MTVRILFLIVNLLFAIHFWWVFSIPLLLLYFYLFGGYEVLFLAVVFGSYYGGSQVVPYYLLGTASLFIFVELVRPFLKKPEEIFA